MNDGTISELAQLQEFVRSLNLKTKYCVTAYIESGYGDNRSQDFEDEQSAIEYALSLDPEYCASLRKEISMMRMSTQIDLSPYVSKKSKL